MTPAPEPVELNPAERLECVRVAERLAPFYETANWKWMLRMWDKGKVIEEMRVPTQYDIERTVRSLAESAIAEGKDKGAMSGGLRVICTKDCAENDPDDPNNPDNHLRFFVTVCP